MNRERKDFALMTGFERTVFLMVFAVLGTAVLAFVGVVMWAIIQVVSKWA